ncbi:MAG TPA: sulfotransferase [Thermoanaerobaculia bacterium]|nr:sulfotransferase [Thermoanaerobaculia bacterium]
MFITGMQRSGTTLLEKLLDAQPSLTILSQPAPLLFVEAKRDFLSTVGKNNAPYPLGHLFGERRYETSDFTAFLASYRLDRERARTLFANMETYSGQYTRFTRDETDAALIDAPFIPMMIALWRNLARREAPVAGAKETTCEEFLPAFLDAGVRCALILRDPRDVLASLNHGRGAEFGGAVKPTLFNLRQWRKSVAFALALEGRPGFHWLRYEDLTADPVGQLERLGAAAEPRLPETWSGNSSHGERHGVSRESVAAFRDVLPRSVIRFAEAACHAELRLLGYDVSIDEDEVPQILRSFEEPYVTRDDMSADAIDDANIARELRRRELLGGCKDSAPYFIFREAHERLRR